MYKTEDSKATVSKYGICYNVIQSKASEDGRSYGICAFLENDKSDCSKVENLFFTYQEAEQYCKWFAENEVYPVSLYDILANIYNI
jgi:hypothetical protein